MVMEGYVKIEIIVFCLDGEWRRSDCDCEYIILYRYWYNFMFNVQVVIDGVWCGFGDKRVQVVVEDYVIFFVV